MKSHVTVMGIDADVIADINEQVLLWGEGRQGTDADVTVMGTVASINTTGTTEVEVVVK